MTVERWTPPGPRGSNGSRLHGVLEYRPSLYRTSPFVFVFGVWLWEFSLAYAEYASFKRSLSYPKHKDKQYRLESFQSRTSSTLRSNDLCHTPNTKTNNISLRVFTYVRPVRFVQTLFVIPQTQRQTKSLEFKSVQSHTSNTLCSNTLHHTPNKKQTI